MNYSVIKKDAKDVVAPAKERYRAGKIPAFLKTEEDHQTQTHTESKIDQDRRLQRQHEIVGKPERNRRRHTAEIIVEDSKSAEPQNKEENIDDANAIAIDRRRKLKELALQRQREETMDLNNTTVDIMKEGISVEEASDYSESSGDDEVMLKPVFVPKEKRQTLTSKIDAEEEELEKRKEIELKNRKIESHNLIVDILNKEIKDTLKETKDPLKVDDTDGLDPAGEYEAWKLRELIRIKRDAENEAERIRVREETELLRNMDDKEREEYLARNRREKPKGGKIEFLQRYYHKGAFYQDIQESEDIFKRDFNQPTLDDHIKKDALPDVMKKKKFGKRGQTKWTHLSAEDTSKKDSGWSKSSKSTSRLGGAKPIFDKPTKKKN
ncbi:hypothetical protein ROZALSC1DRAFT_26498 [Rozella allomycis CSF55]|uniref:Micro-fibrillar-associated protein 1 domain-containing protein n=1 Tax=Rozella allomycis (strain CSF55) TaxID=988480 RepID=A0A075B428_ROZAC|nr:Micro-fibrillar-associated protein 1 domain-containing protein [Rozella allomycis CSF55]RKP22115.1 hypothetical protein ROZALSC1DRAFT_26498 [Rozella allomycis CSF55]|eukprot:EPZ35969.1 Micro-fibrillar-associated protein 1 domain-containing protein [Rozella allomycis CSF55]